MANKSEANTQVRRLRRYLDSQRAALAQPRWLLCAACGDRFPATYGEDRCAPCAREFATRNKETR